ncbi:MAG: hypothetical protein ACNA7X_04115 [Dehalococcoidia bacterium]
MNGDRGGLLSAGGVLTIIVGALEIIAGGLVVALTTLGCCPLALPYCASPPGLETALSPEVGSLGCCAVTPLCMTIVGVILVVLGIIAIAGGVSALRRKSFGLALAGAICTLPSVIFGVLAVIFVSLGREEFEAGY